MIVVFWLEELKPNAVEFQPNEMNAALSMMEHLRRKRRDHGIKISHVCMQSELPDVVGQPGVSDPAKDYDWRKRRDDPSTFGRKICPDCENPGCNQTCAVDDARYGGL